MQRIQSQASDLCYLAEKPHLSTTDTTPTSGTAKDARQLHIENESPLTFPSPEKRSPPSHPPSRHVHSGNTSVTNSRKVTSSRPRKERNPYTTLACKECRRRKVKCSGENPCQRCRSLNLPCLYSTNRRSRLTEESDELKHVTAQVTLLQDEVTRLRDAVGNAQVVSTACPILEDVLPSTEMSYENDPLIQATQSPLQEFSARYVTHSVTENTTSPANGFINFSDVFADMEFGSFHEADDYSAQRPEADMKESQVDPFLTLNKDEMIRLCRLYEGAFDFMYPVVNMQSLIAHAENLTSVESVKDQTNPEPTSDVEMLQLKIVICCALVIEGVDQGEKAARIYENMGNVTDQMLKYDTSSTQNLVSLVLLANYQLLSRNDVSAWRTIWQLARSCLRKGLHRKRGLMKIEESDERTYALNVFWTAYIFDQQLGFYTGLPCVIGEGDIDKELPLPETYPYLVAMITWTKIGIRVWRRWYCLGTPPIPEHPSETVDVLGKEILQWYETLPEQIQLRNLQERSPSLTPPSQGLDRPKTLICFKLLQMRIWLYMPALRSRSTTTANLKQSQHAVSLAKDTVRYLCSLKDTDLDHMTQSFYPGFLLSTIMILFLASIHAPVYFAGACRADFHAAIELTKSLRIEDWLSKRLWKAIQSLKNVAPRFGLSFDECQSMETVRMMSYQNGYLGLNLISEIEVQAPTSISHQPCDEILSSATLNGIQIWTELSYIFEVFTRPSGFRCEQSDEAQSPSRIVHSLTPEPTTEQDRTIFLIFKSLVHTGCSGLWEHF